MAIRANVNRKNIHNQDSIKMMKGVDDLGQGLSQRTDSERPLCNFASQQEDKFRTVKSGLI